MAGRKSGKNKNEAFANSEELLNILNFSGATLCGAVALFGVKKLYDYLSARNSYEVQPQSNSVNRVFLPNSNSKQSVNKLTDLSPSIPDVIPRNGISNEIPYPEEEGYIDEKSRNIKKLEKLNYEKDETLSIASVLDEPEPYTRCMLKSNSTITGNQNEDELEDPFNYELNEINPRFSILCECLKTYHEKFAIFDESLLMNRLQCVQEMKNLFLDFYLKLIPNHPIYKLQDLIDPTDPWRINSANHFKVFVPLHLESNHWKIIDGSETFYAAPASSLVKRVQLDFFTHGTVAYDKYIVGGHLSPIDIGNAMREMTNRVAKWGDFSAVQTSVIGSSVQMKVKYCSDDEITIDFIPKITLKSESIVGLPHPRCSADDTLKILWTQCFMKEENERLMTVYPNGCQLRLVQILRSLSTIHEELVVFTPKVCISIVLHMMEQIEAWDDRFMGERFIDCLLYLTEHLQLGKLSYYFSPSYNLLSEFSSDSISLTSAILDNVIKTDKYEILLNLDHYL